ncbi:hypothetical protein C2855_07590 [Aeromonas bestiarum]|uniref:DUF6572 domain-containing protein n=1 Tax=Aeromonas bestiarum TaxID=105751 RepID=UPI000CD49A2D|nr:DUF6572 domain-containing protein [Aeromonas bestiarum]POG23957.1 hypothetical protein C2855_07590 [Aeromonas bestiarum]
MSLEQANIIDAIGVDNITGYVVLTISDPFEWTHSGDHLLMLQEKINTYLSFVESGEILNAYPDSHAKPVLIDVVHKFYPNLMGQEFYNQLTPIIEKAGMKLQYRKL